MQTRGNELKLVYPQQGAEPERFANLAFVKVGLDGRRRKFPGMLLGDLFERIALRQFLADQFAHASLAVRVRVLVFRAVNRNGPGQFQQHLAKRRRR